MISYSRLLILSVLISAFFMLSGCFDNPTGIDDDNGTEDGTQDPSNYSHVEEPGHSANDFLSAENFPYLEVEIDYMSGFKPDQDALVNLKSFLDLRLHKTSITFREPTEIPASEQRIYSTNDIRELEEKHRDNFTQDNDSTLTAYIIIVDGSYENGSVLGIAHYNTSSAFFGATFDQVSGSSLNQPSRSLTESVSFRHEFGHLLGLVNISGSGTEMQTDHQDDEHGNHCTNKNCLMYYAIENSGLFDRFLGEEIPSLEDNCVADLKANDGR